MVTQEVVEVVVREPLAFLTPTSVLTAVPTLILGSPAPLVSESFLTAFYDEQTTLSADSDLTADPVAIYEGQAHFSAVSTLTATANVVHVAQGHLLAPSTLTANPTGQLVLAQTHLSSVSILTATAIVIHVAHGHLVSVSLLSAAAKQDHYAKTHMVAISILAANATISNQSATAPLNTQSVLTANGVVMGMNNAVANLQACASMGVCCTGAMGVYLQPVSPTDYSVSIPSQCFPTGCIYPNPLVVHAGNNTWHDVNSIIVVSGFPTPTTVTVTVGSVNFVYSCPVADNCNLTLGTGGMGAAYFCNSYMGNCYIPPCMG